MDEREQRESDRDDREVARAVTHAAATRRTRIINYVVIALLAGILIALGAILALQLGQEDRDDSQQGSIDEIEAAQVDQNSAAINTLIEAERQECIAERERLIEGRDRGIAVRDLLEGLIALVAAAPVSQSSPELAQAQIDIFRRDLRAIDILPLPSCDDFADQLREDLGVTRLPGGDASAAPSGGGRSGRHDDGGGS